VFVYYIFQVDITFGSKGRSLPLQRGTVKLRDIGLRLNLHEETFQGHSSLFYRTIGEVYKHFWHYQWSYMLQDSFLYFIIRVIFVNLNMTKFD
jgi:hypothetical protein